MHFDGLIFDMDGTLWNCCKASADAINRSYKIAGVARTVSEEFISALCGKPSNECDELLLAGVPANLRDDLARKLEELEIDAIKEIAANSLYQGVTDGLAILKKDYSLYLVSNCGEAYLNTFLEHSLIGHFFSDSECFGRNLVPKSQNIRAIIERHKLKSACYIGDTAGDEEASAAAAVPFFHASYGFGKATRNPKAFANFDELTKYFLSLREK